MRGYAAVGAEEISIFSRALAFSAAKPRGSRFAAERGMQTINLNDVSYLIIQAAIEVHKAIGPGLLESVYRACLMYELRQRQLSFVAEQLVPLCYKGVILDTAYRSDLLVEDEIVVEVKAVEAVLPVHEAQLLSYLRLMNKPLGLLINFNVPLLTDGVTRKMNGFRVAPLRSKEPAADLGHGGISTRRHEDTEKH